MSADDKATGQGDLDSVSGVFTDATVADTFDQSPDAAGDPALRMHDAFLAWIRRQPPCAVAEDLRPLMNAGWRAQRVAGDEVAVVRAEEGVRSDSVGGGCQLLPASEVDAQGVPAVPAVAAELGNCADPLIGNSAGQSHVSRASRACP